MASNPPGPCCVVGSIHEGTPTGKSIKLDGNIDAYLALPEEGKRHKNVAIVFLPDVIGIWQNSKLMADQFALNGYITLLVDTFNGDPMPLNKPEGFNPMQWIAHGSNGDNPHTPETIDPIVKTAIKAVQDHGATKIGAVGYCFGAKYVARHYKSGIDVGYMAHPSFVDEEELAAIPGPLAISAAETDAIFPTEKRHRSEEILKASGIPYQINLFSQVEHGFSVRGNMENKVERWAKEQAFLQAVAWFNWHLL